MSEKNGVITGTVRSLPSIVNNRTQAVRQIAGKEVIILPQFTTINKIGTMVLVESIGDAIAIRVPLEWVITSEKNIKKIETYLNPGDIKRVKEQRMAKLV